jgi:hypothetical protein
VGIVAWFGRRREWRRDHLASFAIASEILPDSLTLFQHECLSTLKRALPAAIFIQTGPEDGSTGKWLEAPFCSDGAKLCIYQNEAMIFGGRKNVWFEEWDYRTPKT